MAARTVSLENARRPLSSPAGRTSAVPQTRRTIRRPPVHTASAACMQVNCRAPARAAQPEPRVYRHPSTVPHTPVRRKKRRLRVAVFKLAVLALCFWAVLSVFNLLARQQLFASLGSLVSGHFLSIPGPEPLANGSGMLSVEPVLQNPQLPNGCEAASLATLLEYNGFSVDLGALAADYLPSESFSYGGPNRYGPDPEQAYAGDPFSTTNGWYCFEGPVVKAANAYLRAQGSDQTARAITGADMAQLEQLLRQGTPVAVWFTQDYEMPRMHSSFTWTMPDGRTCTPYANLHCVVLTGMDADQCYLADPLQGSTSLQRDWFEAIYTAMGSRGVVIQSSH